MMGARWFLDDLKNQNFSFDRGMQLAGYNTGNLLIGEAMKRHLEHIFPKIEKLRYLNREEITSEAYIGGAWADKNFDCIIMSAANLINENIDLSVEADFVEKTGLPFFIFGIGAQAEDSSARINIPDGTKRLLKIASERSYAIGVRGGYSAEVVASLGITNIEIMGCPSMYLNRSKAYEIKPIDTDKALSAAIFTKRDGLGYKSHKKLADAQRLLIRKAIDGGYPYIIQTNFAEAWCAFHHRLDEEHVTNIAEAFQIPSSELETFERYLNDKLKIFFRYADWQTFLENIDFTIGARFHGTMMSILNQIPAICICHDSRTVELCDHFRLPFLHTNDIDLDNFDIGKTALDVDFSDFNKQYPLKVAAFDAFLGRQFQAFSK
jgi:hypothetical protein